MSTPLVLSDDEIALLRFTCDLFFVDESPLWSFESDQRAPADYAGSYQALVDRGVVDPHGFRITDDALNRIAPVTECDARIVHLETQDDGSVVQEDHWLLDEISVLYERHALPGGARHLFGHDLDADALVARLGRRLLPRRTPGHRFDAILTPVEVLATSLLLTTAAARERRSLADDDVRALLAKVPAEDAVLPAAGVQAVSLLAFQKAKEPRSVDSVLRALLEKRVLTRDGTGVRVDGALATLQGFTGRVRHTLVRTDFREDDWLVREVTFLPVDGSLFVITPVRGGFRIAELDGDALRDVLHESIAPQRSTTKPVQRFASLLAGARK
jgi:hypothetical protein